MMLTVDVVTVERVRPAPWVFGPVFGDLSMSVSEPTVSGLVAMGPEPDLQLTQLTATAEKFPS